MSEQVKRHQLTQAGVESKLQSEINTLQSKLKQLGTASGDQDRVKGASQQHQARIEELREVTAQQDLAIRALTDKLHEARADSALYKQSLDQAKSDFETERASLKRELEDALKRTG